MLCGIVEEFAFLIGQRAALACWAADIQMTAFQALSWWNQGASTQNDFFFQYRPVHDDGTDADQTQVSDLASMEDRTMPDGDLLSYGQWKATR